MEITIHNCERIHTRVKDNSDFRLPYAILHLTINDNEFINMYFDDTESIISFANNIINSAHEAEKEETTQLP